MIGLRREVLEAHGEVEALVQLGARVDLNVACRASARRQRDVETPSERGHLCVAEPFFVAVPLLGSVVGGDEDDREACGNEAALDLETQRVRVENLEHLLQLHLALELFEHDRRLSRVAVPPEAAVAHVYAVDVRVEIVNGVALSDAGRANDRDDLESVPARRRSECGELEAVGAVLEEDGGVDCANVARPHELVCRLVEVCAIALLRHRAEFPGSCDASFGLRAVRLVLLSVSLCLEESCTIKDVKDFTFCCFRGDLPKPCHALSSSELNEALKMWCALFTAFELIDDVFDTIGETVREQHLACGVVYGEAPRAHRLLAFSCRRHPFLRSKMLKKMKKVTVAA